MNIRGMCDCCLKEHVSNFCDSYITARTMWATFVTAISRREQREQPLWQLYHDEQPLWQLFHGENK